MSADPVSTGRVRGAAGPLAAPADGLGLLGLALAAGHGVHALSTRDAFLHLGAPDPDGGWAAWALLGLGSVTALLALRRSRAWSVLLALALLAPFLVDVLTHPWLADLDATPRRRAFAITTSAVLVLLAAAGWRRASVAARARGAHPAGSARPGAAGPRAPSAGPARVTAARPGAPSAARRIGLACAAAALALAAGELLLQRFGRRPFVTPKLLFPDGHAVPLGEITTFRHWDSTTGPAGPATSFRPRLYLRGWYDRPQWDYFDADGCVDYVFDGLGLRDDDVSRAKPAGTERIVAIGDSFTFGVGVQQRDAWTEVLQRRLGERRGHPVEVVNAGFASGHDPTMYEEWIAGAGLALDPDRVIVALCLNDIDERIRLYAYKEHRPATILGRPSALAEVLARLWRRARGAPLVRRDYARFVDDDHERWGQCRRSLENTRDTLAAAGVAFTVAIMPMVSGIDPDYAYAALNERVKAFCAGAGIDCVDLVPQVLGRDERSLWVHPTDQHPNDVGHSLIAEGILEHLAGT